MTSFLFRGWTRAGVRGVVFAGILSASLSVAASPLLDALAMADHDAMAEQLKADPGLASMPDGIGDSPLLLAVRAGDLAAVKLLVDAGAPVTQSSASGETPLQVSMLSGRGEVTQWLLRHGAEPDQFNGGGQSALHWCAQAGEVALCERFLKGGLSPLQRDATGLTPMDLAIGWGRFDVLGVLLAATPTPPSRDVVTLDFDDDRVRYWSALYWSGDEAALLASLGQDLQSSYPHPLAPYIWSAVHRRQDTLEAALTQASPALKQALGITPQMLMAVDAAPREAWKAFPATAAYRLGEVYALVELADSARDLGEFGVFYDYLETAVTLAPNHWQLAWMFDNMTALDLPGMRERAAAFAQAEAVRGGFTGGYLQAVVPQHSWKNSDQLAHVDRYLERWPHDGRALVARSLTLKGNGYYREAVESHMAGLARFPFYAGRSDAMELLIKTGQHDRARRVAEGLARWYGNEGVPARAARYYAAGLLDDGDKGAARGALSEALARYPDEGRLWMEQARLALAEQRPDEALAAAATGFPLIESPSSGQLADWLQAYRDSGDPRGGVSVFERYRERVGMPSASLLNSVLEDLATLQDTQRYQALLREARSYYPHDRELLLRQARQDVAEGRQASALALLEDGLARHGHSLDYLSQTYDVLLAVRGEASARRFVVQRQERMPWEKASWQLAKQHGAGEEPALWEAAIVAAPTETFGCEALIDYYVSAKAWRQAHDWAQQCHERFVSTGRLSARQSMLLYDAWVYENQTRQERVDSETLREAQTAFDEFARGHGHYMDYLRYREAFCLARGDKSCAAQSLAQRSAYQQDSTSHFHDLVARYANELGADKTFGYGARMLARSPYDSSKVASFLHKHLLWGGSSIVALKAINDAETRGVSVDKKWQRRALGNLGDSLSSFERYTVAGMRPSASLRYIRWFDEARRDALSADGTRVFYQLDSEIPGVEILLPSGEQVVRQDHPVFGKPLYFARGATFMRLGYTETGQLTRIEDSSGQSMTLLYDKDDQIRTLISPEGTLHFTYNALGKPVRIVEQDVGVLEVAYDEQGEILSVNSEQGQQMALRITRSFQSLLGMVNQVKRIHDVKRLPRLSVNDPQVDALRVEYEDTEYHSAEEQKAALALAKYLIGQVGDDPDYVGESERLLYGVVATAQVHSREKAFRHRGAQAVTLLHQLYREVRPRGLPQETFSEWSEAWNWLRSAELEASSSTLRKALAAVNEAPLALLRDAHRLQRSDFSNTAYWKRYGDHELFGKALAGTEKHQVVMRANGDVVVATSQGLSVLREGYWHWYGFDFRQQRLSATAVLSEQDARANILAVTETEDGILWLGTAKGLLAIPGDYDGDLKRWSVAEGLPSPRVISLTSRGSRVWAGTGAGLVVLEYAQANPQAVTAAGTHPIDQLYRLPGRPDALLYRANHQVWLLSGDAPVSLGRGQDMTFDMGRMRVYRLEGNQVFAHAVTDENGRWEWLQQDAELVATDSDLLLSKQVHGLSMWDLGSGEEALVVSTDRAMNVLQGHYFEALALPFAEQRGGMAVGPRHSFSDSRGVVVLSNEGVYTRLGEGAQQLQQAPVYDLLVSQTLNSLYVAMGDHILLLGNDQPLESAQYFSSANARVLAEDQHGNLLTHDGYTVLRFPAGSDQPQELFSARPAVEEKGWQGGVVDMLVDREGTLWVVSGSSLFRYRQETLTEFNYLLDSERFPSRSPMLARVHETLAGEIEVVASDEGHLTHQGVSLSGGLLRWNGNGFEHVGKPPHWFVTGYTPVDDRTAVIGTNTTFARELTGGTRQSFAELNDPSYQALADKTPLLWLGGEGARFQGSNSWLFPSAGGVLLYHGGTWLYPDRLNQLLPEDAALGQYGGRTVHAVAVAGNGRVYVGTDLGLLLYDSQGVASLLNDNHFGQLAFREEDTQQQQALSDIFLPAISGDSDAGKMLARYRQMEAQIRELETRVAQPVPEADAATLSGAAASGSAVKGVSDSPRAERLRQQLKSKNRLRETLLARMEAEHAGLYQMLKLDPREVAALHQRLSEDQALVQYLPTPEKLLIQLVTREGAQIREVQVSRADLEAASALVVKGMRYRAAHLTGNDRGLSASGERTAGPDDDAQDANLAWLYDKLLRPVERELEGKQQVLVTPVGALTYLPFPALLRKKEGDVREYAAERFNIGVIPSMYHLSLVLQQNESFSDGLTMVADPDGSLPGARQEVSRIARGALVAPTVLEGASATYANLAGAVQDARVVHLATHGNLDPAVPADSYLLLANNYRLNVIDIAGLTLDQTDLVVLSACETGIGKPGLEYATLARAFALASVPTVIASYWKVDDGATARLMEQFYGNLREYPGEGYLVAMAQAQRALIEEGGRYSEPAAWAAFTLFGKP